MDREEEHAEKMNDMQVVKRSMLDNPLISDLPFCSFRKTTGHHIITATNLEKHESCVEVL